MLNCKICGSVVPDSEAVCPTCGAAAGAPNVRGADRPEELQALEERYQEAYKTARDGNYLQALEEFDKALEQSHAVINVNLDFLHFLPEAKETYMLLMNEVWKAKYESPPGWTPIEIGEK